MSDSDESAKLWKVNRTIHELVQDRVRVFPLVTRLARTHAFRTHDWRVQGYQVSDDEINMDLNTFKAHYASQTGVVECVSHAMSFDLWSHSFARPVVAN